MRKDGKTIYREWAPGAKAAALIGDFNNWECAWMQKDEWGVWSVELPDGEQQVFAAAAAGEGCSRE